MAKFQNNSFKPSEVTFQIGRIGDFLDYIHVDTKPMEESPYINFSGPIYDTMSDQTKV